MAVQFKIHKDGQLSNVVLVHPSGVAQADEAALNTLSELGQLAPLPYGAPKDVDVLFTFDYNVFRGQYGRQGTTPVQDGVTD